MGQEANKKRYKNFDWIPYAKHKGRKIKQLVGSTKNRVVLDLGCGDYRAKKLFPGCTYLGLDITLGHDLENKWPVKNNSIDIVFASEIIEHVLDTEHMFSEMHRVVKPGGMVIVTTPNVASFGSRIKVLFGGNVPAMAGNPTHVRTFTLRDLERWGQRVGLLPTDVKGYYIDIIPNKPYWTIQLADIFPTLSNCLIVKYKKSIKRMARRTQ